MATEISIARGHKGIKEDSLFYETVVEEWDSLHIKHSNVRYLVVGILWLHLCRLCQGISLDREGQDWIDESSVALDPCHPNATNAQHSI